MPSYNGGEWYRFSVECFLKEFGVVSPYAYIPVKNTIHELERNTSRYQAVILPQNPSYKDGLIREIQLLCEKKGNLQLSFSSICRSGVFVPFARAGFLKDGWMKLPRQR